MRIQRASEGQRYTQYRPEQIRVQKILQDTGLMFNAEVGYIVYDDLNEKNKEYVADMMNRLAQPKVIVEIQGTSHDSKKGMLKTDRKRELSIKAGFIFIELDAEIAAKALDKQILQEYWSQWMDQRFGL